MEAFVKSLTAYEKALALFPQKFQVNQAQFSGFCIFFDSTDFHEKFNERILSFLYEINFHLLCQFVGEIDSLLISGEFDKIADCLKSFRVNKGKYLSTKDIIDVLDVIMLMSDFSRFRYNRYSAPQINTDLLEEFYTESSSRLNQKRLIQFACVYGLQNGYKKSLVESILNLVCSECEDISTKTFYDTLHIIFEKVNDDFSQLPYIFSKNNLAIVPFSRFSRSQNKTTFSMKCLIRTKENSCTCSL